MTVVLRCERMTAGLNGRDLLHDVSLEVHKGEVVALVGPNGAGKSTLLSVLAGDIPPRAGSVTLFDRPLASYKPKELALLRSVLPQQAIIQFSFTAREIVRMGRSPHGDMDDEILAIEHAISQTDSSHLAHRIFPTLSVGEQARVSLARVLAQEAPLLLLDEPTAALDLRHQQLVQQIARDYANAGATIVMIVHDLNYAAALADRIVLMSNGSIAANGGPSAILTPAMVRDVFECDVVVTYHPEDGTPVVLPMKKTGSVVRSSGD
ncbi:MAG: heme ABC transporter ATP-binding protein [Thermomicrobiales bacterium]|nr:heme ABC transporter ATP-binding protein [Thermomicrobiales bacterium]